ncbi:MAG: EamA family transporter [Proteobacteria bacterium]|nr:EamA family transporter [Pseudomonadota bacterium]
MSPRDVSIAILVMLVWGLNFAAIKIGVEGFPPLFLTGLRFLFTALPMVFFLGRPAAPWRFIVAFGLLLGVVKFGLVFSAVKLGMPTGLVSLLMQLQVFFTMFLAILLLGEKARPYPVLGALLAFGGISVFIVERLQSAVPLLPLAMVIAASLTWGLANIVIKKAGRVDVLAFLVWSSLFSPLPLFALSWGIEGSEAILASLVAPRLESVLALVFIVGPSTLFAFAAWNRLLTRYPTQVAAPFALLVPVFGIFSGVLLLGEPFTRMAFYGSGIVFLGLVINVFGERLFARAARPKTEMP